MERRRTFNRAELASSVVALAFITLLGTAACDRLGGGRIAERGEITRGISNCRQIITALRIYSADHNGKYPDAAIQGSKTANRVFRKLFDEQVLDNEMIFGCPVSPFEPDGVIQDSYIGPDSTKFSKAVQAGENHWAMTAGVTDSSANSIPLVYENPVTSAWPAKWNADAAHKPVRGRAWKNGVIVGLNDSSVTIQPLAARNGNAVGLKPDAATGKDPFEAALDPKAFPKGEVLDVE